MPGKNLQMAGLWILVLLVLGILTWSLWPSPIIHDSYKTSLDQPFITEQPCRVDKIFDGISFNLTYPEFTNSDSVFYIDLLVRKEISDQNLLLNGCDSALELLLTGNKRLHLDIHSDTLGNTCAA